MPKIRSHKKYYSKHRLHSSHNSHFNHDSHFNYRSYSNPNDRPENNTIIYYDVNQYSKEGYDIKDLFPPSKIVIDAIEKVVNPYLQQKYEAKKQQKMFMYDFVEERWLFHGTSWSNIDSICRFNFNWRLNGSNRGHRFGQGVSFSPCARYASDYSDPFHNKVMILSKVLVAKSCVGYKDTVLPPIGFDTTQKIDGKVIVKYEDNEFYPAYKIYYHLEHSPRNYDNYHQYNSSYDSYNSSFDPDHNNSSYYNCPYY